MAGLDVNNSFFSEAFERYKQKFQGELKKNRSDATDAATSTLDKKGNIVEITVVNREGKEEKLKINNEMKRLLGMPISIREKDAGKLPPTNERIMRRDNTGGINIEKSLGETSIDSNGNLLQGESINFYIDENGIPLETNLQYFNNGIGYCISLDPSGNIELTKGGEINGIAFDNKIELKQYIDTNYPNNIPKFLDYFIPDRA